MEQEEIIERLRESFNGEFFIMGEDSMPIYEKGYTDAHAAYIAIEDENGGVYMDWFHDDFTEKIYS